MKAPPEVIIAALERGEAVRCGGHVSRRLPDLVHQVLNEPAKPLPQAPIGHFYCAQCREVRCGLCVFKGFCVVCRALVRSTQNLLHAKEHSLEHD